MMEIVEAPPDDEWDDFCDRSPTAWFWHTSAWQEYTLAYRPQLASTARRFFVKDGDETLVAVPTMVERHENGAALSFGGGDCWAPAISGDLTPRRRSEALRLALVHVDILAADVGATRCSFRLTPLVRAFAEACSSFLAETTRAGYGDVSATTTVLDLSPPADTILKGMRKGHRTDIARARRSLAIDVYDAATITPEAFDEYRLLHQRAAGRVTRPLRTFELMAEWVGTGNAVLLTARRDDRPVSCAYLNLYGQGAYYSSAANDPDVREPAGHLLQWQAIEWLKLHGYRRYELGIQQFGPLPHEVPSVKELNIGRFKRGFGGDLLPVPVREKWFDVAAYRQVTAERCASYTAALMALASSDEPGA